MSGFETISISATPERLRSTSDIVGMLVVQRLAGILLEMQALDPDVGWLSPSGRSTTISPSPTIGDLYWLI